MEDFYLLLISGILALTSLAIGSLIYAFSLKNKLVIEDANSNDLEAINV